MSKPDKSKYHCIKCDAIVNPKNEKCPNGHDLKEVGIILKLLLEDELTLADQLGELNLSKVEEKLLKKIGNRMRKAMKERGINSITIKTPLLDIQIDERSQDAK